MATAMAFPEAFKVGRKRNGEWFPEETIEGKEYSKATLSKARYVLRNNPLADGKDYPQRCLDIMAGTLSLTEAYVSATADRFIQARVPHACAR